MSEFSGRPTRYLFALLGLTVMASGGAFFWANLPSTANAPMGGVAVAAPQPITPQKITRPQAATKAERIAAQKTIAAQLNAFNKGDWKEAVKYQSEGLKTNFASPEDFGQMIEQMYPAFVHPQKIEYGRAMSIAGSIQFEVNLVGQDNSNTYATYILVKEKGNYRVASVAGGTSSQPVNNNADIV